MMNNWLWGYVTITNSNNCILRRTFQCTNYFSLHFLSDCHQNQDIDTGCSEVHPSSHSCCVPKPKPKPSPSPSPNSSPSPSSSASPSPSPACLTPEAFLSPSQCTAASWDCTFDQQKAMDSVYVCSVKLTELLMC